MNKRVLMGMLAVLLVFSLVLVGCGDSPKSLAKEMYRFVEDRIRFESGSFELLGSLEKRSEKIMEKLDKLSESDQKALEEELKKLGYDKVWEYWKNM